MMRGVTFCTMLQTDGRTHVYGIFRGRLQRADRPRSEQYIHLHQAVRVAVESSRLGPAEFDYFEAARRYASDEYPPFSWSDSAADTEYVT
jgi:hypothetical protein